MNLEPTVEDRALAMRIGAWLMDGQSLERHEADHCARLIRSSFDEQTKAMRERLNLDRALFEGIYTAMLAAGWRDDEMLKRVKAAAASTTTASTTTK